MRYAIAVLVFAALLAPALTAAHFQMILPSDNIVVDRNKSEITLDVRFAHPFEQGVMDMAPPVRIGVRVDGKTTDLGARLVKKKVGKDRVYTTAYRIRKPGDHLFFVEPAPFWEPAEDKYIIHYTKTVVHGFGLEDGWDDLVGFPIEVKPLTRPYGLWTGNVFLGQVLIKGKPVPHAEVEVAYFNKGKKVPSPGEVFHIQVVKADDRGIFTYAMPREGWWGFAALEEASYKLKDPNGKDKAVEIGAVLWVRTKDMK